MKALSQNPGIAILAGWLRPREAQRGPERRSVDRTSLSCAWLEAPHKKIYDQGGSPQIFVWNRKKEAPADYHNIASGVP